MENKHDIESLELLARNRQGQADEDGVEDDAEFEDKDSRHLRSVVFMALSAKAHVVGLWVGVVVITVVTQVVFARSVRVGADTGFTL